MEHKARNRLQTMRRDLSRHEEVLREHALGLDPDSRVVAPEDRVRRRQLNEISSVQMSTRTSVGRTMHTVESIQNKGRETLKLLGEDTEALERAQGDVDATNSLNNRARRALEGIASRIWRDKFLQWGIIIIELLIIALIIYLKYIRQ
uniref:t-SNARE coiled-coil homology domain-containing protein n=2 Tax=Lotharella globosa TaxID=91324 RepID=A0A7S4DH20_9EUKA